MCSTITPSAFAARLREFIKASVRDSLEPGGRGARLTRGPDACSERERAFDRLAADLFTFQFERNQPYRRFCQARHSSPAIVSDWTQIPAVPVSAFKEVDLSCLPVEARTSVFYSSGTTGQRVSRHFHNDESLAIYEASVLAGFGAHVIPDVQFPIFNLQTLQESPRSDAQWETLIYRQRERTAVDDWTLAILTPPPAQAPHSSLVYMFDTVRRAMGAPDSAFAGDIGPDGAWTLDSEIALNALRMAVAGRQRVLLLGTAFSFVHLVELVAENKSRFELPAGSRALETGGYKGRSRSLPKDELHSLITRSLGIPPSHIACEYGMSELSSQAYDGTIGERPLETGSWPTSGWKPLQLSGWKPDPRPGACWGTTDCPSAFVRRVFQFPLWARAQIVSPETGREVGEGETGLIRVLDLANVHSVLAIQTEDLGIRRGDGFEFVGRAALAEPRGCSLTAI